MAFEDHDAVFGHLGNSFANDAALLRFVVIGLFRVIGIDAKMRVFVGKVVAHEAIAVRTEVLLYQEGDLVSLFALSAQLVAAPVIEELDEVAKQRGRAFAAEGRHEGLILEALHRAIAARQDVLEAVAVDAGIRLLRAFREEAEQDILQGDAVAVGNAVAAGIELVGVLSDRRVYGAHAIQFRWLSIRNEFRRLDGVVVPYKIVSDDDPPLCPSF